MKSKSKRAFCLASNIMVLTLAATAGNLECSQIGTWNLPFSEDAQGVLVSGSTAYVAAGYDGLVIYDITEPHNPVKLGQLETYYAYDVAVNGNHAYVADYEGGLRIIDISTPAAPSLVATYPTSDYAYGLDVAGSYAYVAIDSGGLEIINIATPSTPTFAGSYPTSEYISDTSPMSLCAGTTPSRRTTVTACSSSISAPPHRPPS